MTSSFSSDEGNPVAAEITPEALSLCVFCGARRGNGPAPTAAAREIGRLIGDRGHNLVYGAGASGLMGEVAWSASRSGSKVTGFAPHFIYEREAGDDAPRQTLFLTKDIFERKRRMIEHSDAFIALPGGFGTLDEVLEVLSLNYLEVSDKPLILLNTDDFWGGLVRFTDSLRDAGFAIRGANEMFHVAATPHEALAFAERLTEARKADMRRIPAMTAPTAGARVPADILADEHG